MAFYGAQLHEEDITRVLYWRRWEPTQPPIRIIGLFLTTSISSISACFSFFCLRARRITPSSSESEAPFRIRSRKETSLSSNKQTYTNSVVLGLSGFDAENKGKGGGEGGRRCLLWFDRLPWDEDGYMYYRSGLTCYWWTQKSPCNQELGTNGQYRLARQSLSGLQGGWRKYVLGVPQTKSSCAYPKSYLSRKYLKKRNKTIR